MTKRTGLTMLALSIAALLVAACGAALPPAAPAPTVEREVADDADMPEHPGSDAEAMADEEMDESMDEAMDETMEETIEESEEMAEMGEESMSPAWFTAELVDVNTGAIFSIADYKGKVVLVETMAIWCSTCLRQQQHLQSLHSSLADAEDDLVSITLDVDPNEDAGMLERYTDRNGFDWIYAVAPAAVSRELADLYGNLFLNPPSAPILVIDRHGEAHPLPFGLKDVGTLMEHLSPFLAEGM